MTVTVASFRTGFPEFASASDYPDGQVMFWLVMAGTMLNPDAWNDFLDVGTMLYIAHHLAIGIKDQKSVAAGGVPGTVNGPQSSKSVDKVSASYDTGSVVYDGGGFWNSTMYGIRFYQMARLAGAGGVQM